MKTIKRKKDGRKPSIWDRTPSEYIPYKDSKGNLLSEPEDILFMSEEAYNEEFSRQNFAVWGAREKKKNYYTVNSPDIKRNYGSEGNFPDSLTSPTGELLNVKLSAKTHERLPLYAGNTEVIDIVLVGAPSIGKTTYLTQILSPIFHSLLALEGDCSVQEALFTDTTAREVYEQAVHNMKEGGLCPEPTVYSPDTFMPCTYYVSYCGDGESTRHVVLRMHDIDGEQALHLTHKNTLLNYEYMFLMIGADELIDGDRYNGQYKKILNHFLQSAAVKGTLGSTKITVIITKADLLMKEPCGSSLEAALPNTIKMEDDVILPKSRAGFSYSDFEARKSVIKRFLKENYPAFYLMLMNNVSDPEAIEFCMMASLGAATDKNNKITEYKPFCIDLPICKILADTGVFKISADGDNESERPYEEKISGLGGGKAAEAFKKAFSKVRRKLNIVSDDDEDFDDEEDVYGERFR